MTIFRLFLTLGFTSFGGPAAHLALFHQVFVRERQWLSAQQYQWLLAWSSALPGPSSSQVGLGIGYLRGGLWGALAAWLGFTLPIATLLIAAALGVQQVSSAGLDAASQSIQWLIIAVIAKAAWDMVKQQVHQRYQALLLVIGVLAGVFATHQLLAVGLVALGAVLGLQQSGLSLGALPKPRMNIFSALFIAIGLLSFLAGDQLWAAAYRVGALVIGGGHVALPWMQNEAALMQGATTQTFWAGYGLTQALPGPMFGFAGYLGALAGGNVLSGVVAVLAVFLPGALLILAIARMPATQSAGTQALLNGAVPVAIGLLFSALATPLDWAYRAGLDAWLSIALAGALLAARVPVPYLVIGFAVLGWVR